MQVSIYMPRFVLHSDVFNQPTLNPDSSIWSDIAVFDRVTLHTVRSCQRDDIVAVRYALIILVLWPSQPNSDMKVSC